MRKNGILLIEDEAEPAEAMTDFFGRHGYWAVRAKNSKEALRIFRENQSLIDVILLKTVLPDMDGYELMRELRKIHDVPVIVLTGRASVADQIAGFEKGVDDYIMKPYTPELIELRIEAILKRSGKLKARLDCGDISIDTAGQRVYWRGSYVEMTRKEYELLVYFVEHRGVVLARGAILDAVWGYDYVGDIRTVDTHVKQIRKKLTEECTYIRSVYGVGYLFDEHTGSW